MDATQLHLLVNHLPIVGSFLGLALAVLALVRRGEGALHAATLVLGLSAAGGVAAWRSGEGAEEAAEERPGFDHDAVEEHEESAVPATLLLAVAAGIGGWLSVRAARGEALPPAAAAAWIVASLAATGMLTQMGLTGRALGHPQLYGRSAPAPAVQPPATPSSGPGAGDGVAGD